MRYYAHGSKTFTIELRQDLLTKNRKELLKIAKENLYAKQVIELFWGDQPGTVILYHPHLSFGITQKVCQALDVEPILRAQI